MPRTKRATKARAEKPAAELPDWLTETMPEASYKLEIMCGCGDCNTEAVDLSRAEYIELKQHLAKMRGYAIPKLVA